jgi:deoxyribonuclease-1
MLIPRLITAPRSPARLLVFSLLVACGTDPASATPERDMEQPAPDMGADLEPGVDLPVVADATPDASGEDMATPGGEFPARITTNGARFETFLRPNERVSIALDGVAGDRVTIWLRRREGVEWLPALYLYQGASQNQIFSSAATSKDAHIPFSTDPARIEQGWELRVDGPHRLELENRSQTLTGPLELELTCKGGPCLGPLPDRDADGVPDASDNCPDDANPNQSDMDNDRLGDVCDPNNNPVDPYEGLSGDALKNAIRANRMHDGLGYDRAREVMYGTVDNQGGELECVYTGTIVQHPAGSTATPSDFNAEHTWPQSQGAGTEPARSDLHHLFPTTAGSNNRRSNLPFCVVVGSPSWEQGGSKLGKDSAGNSCFEPRNIHKGDVARALFYFSVVYNYTIAPAQEAALRQWHLSYPPDAADIVRNDRVQAAQRSRNVFVDRPELVARIADF